MAMGTSKETAGIETLNIDPKIVPWSIRGSYMAIAALSGQNGSLTPDKGVGSVYLINHRYPAGIPLISLRPVEKESRKEEGGSEPDGFPTTWSGFDVAASPGSLWFEESGTGEGKGKGKRVEMTWEDYRTLRIRGKGVFQMDTDENVKVDGWRNWLYRVPRPRSQDRHSSQDRIDLGKGEEANVEGDTAEGRGYDGGVIDQAEIVYTPNAAIRIGLLYGKMDLKNDAPVGFDFKKMNRRITISPLDPSLVDTPKTGRRGPRGQEGDEDGWEWEISISEIELDPKDPLSPSLNPTKAFATHKQNLERGFREYVEGMCDWETITPVDWLACYIMFTSTVRKCGYLTCEAVLMSKLWMNKLWSWDNCFNGLSLASLSPKHALDQILLPFQHQTPQGRLPDSLMPQEALYDYTKPPIYGWTFYTLLSLLDPQSTTTSPRFDVLDKETLRDVYDKVGRFTDYWYKHRSTHVSSLPYYVHGNDSGWDNATCFDDQTVCVSPDLAAFLVVQCDFLEKLAVHLDQKPERWGLLKEKTIHGLMTELWDDQHGFLFKDAYTGQTWPSTSLLQYIPLVASPYLPVDVAAKLAQGVRNHLTQWGLATEDLKSDKYEPDGYWRGPIWAPPTILIESGLRQAGQVGLADEILDRYISLCANHGFAENYNAVEGTGNRDLSYTWAASTYLVLRRQSERRRKE